MLLKKKLCITALFGGILFFMIASYTIQKNSFLIYIYEPARNTHMTYRNMQTQIKTEMWQNHSCRCKTCITDKGISKWFDQRFDPKQQPYLSLKKYQIDQESLQWWLVSLVLSSQKLHHVIIWCLLAQVDQLFTWMCVCLYKGAQFSEKCDKCVRRVLMNQVNKIRILFSNEILNY